MKRLTLRKIRGRCGEIAETALERKEKTRRLGLRHCKALLLSIRDRFLPTVLRKKLLVER